MIEGDAWSGLGSTGRWPVPFGGSPNVHEAQPPIGNSEKFPKKRKRFILFKKNIQLLLFLMMSKTNSALY